MTADANAWAADQALGDAPFLLSLKNGGGIRAQIGTVSDPDPVTGEIDKLPPAANPDANKPEGAISQLDMENSLRFNNRLMVFDTTPQGLLNILNWGAGLPANNGGFPQIGGVRFSFDPDLPGNSGTTPGSRIRDVALIDDNGNVIAQIVDDGVVLADAPDLITRRDAELHRQRRRRLSGQGERRELPLPARQRNPVGSGVARRWTSRRPPTCRPMRLASRRPSRSTCRSSMRRRRLPTTRPTRRSRATRGCRTSTSARTLCSNSPPIVGTNDDDDIDGTDGDDTIDAKAGDDRVRSLGGDDVVLGGIGDDVLEGGDGKDRLEGGDGDDFVFGDRGDDTIIGGKGNDRLRGNDGNDLFLVTDHTTDGADKYDGGAGIDTIDFSASSKAITLTLSDGTASFGSDTITNMENIFGGSNADRLTGNTLANHLRGNGGNDRLEGRDGNDLLDGGEGVDALDGGDGNDHLLGGAGNNSLKGGDDNDLLEGGDGNDTLDGGDEEDTLNGGAGNDVLKGGDGDDVLNAGDDDDTLDGGDDQDTLNGGAGIDVLKGGDGNDVLNAGDGADKLDGGSGNDRLFGGAGVDVLAGGDGTDFLVGGAGNDKLTGGGGVDQFGFNSLSDGIDTITDFRVTGSAQDQIVLSATIWSWALPVTRKSVMVSMPSLQTVD